MTSIFTSTLAIILAKKKRPLMTVMISLCTDEAKMKQCCQKDNDKYEREFAIKF